MEKLCCVLNVSRSGYYKWRSRPESERARQHREWTENVKQAYAQSNRLYGSPKLTRHLKRSGIAISERTVSREPHHVNVAGG
ncbi:IS3 family transposase [Paenibacillus sophorae]|uniref:IS3 family transposase n=1 Tax=Paenibacillus sophorae TaxID=1333845 RepID=A0ABX8H4V1_9BACL|nr:IS3 family transposase [Paenibacillus sophorae]QWU13153.1 IS3 family transposase [Paenibacillus sophorae]